MSKIHIGDYVYHDTYRTNGMVIGDRGGYVGRYAIKADNGEHYYASSRDLIVIKCAQPCYPNNRASLEQKIDLLFEHLGLEIDDTIKIVKRENDGEKATSTANW